MLRTMIFMSGARRLVEEGRKVGCGWLVASRTKGAQARGGPQQSSALDLNSHLLCLPLSAMSSQHPLPQIGAHCSLSSCSLNDFLPIRCTCQQLFCRDHISPDIHHCPLLRAAPPTASSSPQLDRKSTRLNSSHSGESRMPSSA